MEKSLGKLSDFKQDVLNWAKADGFDITYKDEARGIDMSIWTIYVDFYLDDKYPDRQGWVINETTDSISVLL